jgi:integrase
MPPSLPSARSGISAKDRKVFAHLYNSDKTVGARGWFGIALADAKIKNFRWHDLRHTFASRLVMTGVDIRTVQQLKGHKTIQVTLRYAHLAPPNWRRFNNYVRYWGCAAIQLTPELTPTFLGR